MLLGGAGDTECARQNSSHALAACGPAVVDIADGARPVSTCAAHPRLNRATNAPRPTREFDHVLHRLMGLWISGIEAEPSNYHLCGLVGSPRCRHGDSVALDQDGAVRQCP